MVLAYPCARSKCDVALSMQRRTIGTLLIAKSREPVLPPMSAAAALLPPQMTSPTNTATIKTTSSIQSPKRCRTSADENARPAGVLLFQERQDLHAARRATSHVKAVAMTARCVVTMPTHGPPPAPEPPITQEETSGNMISPPLVYFAPALDAQARGSLRRPWQNSARR